MKCQFGSSVKKKENWHWSRKGDLWKRALVRASIGWCHLGYSNSERNLKPLWAISVALVAIQLVAVQLAVTQPSKCNHEFWVSITAGEPQSYRCLGHGIPWFPLLISLSSHFTKLTGLYAHSSPLRLVKITDCPRHSNQSNSVLTLINYIQSW